MVKLKTKMALQIRLRDKNENKHVMYGVLKQD